MLRGLVSWKYWSWFNSNSKNKGVLQIKFEALIALKFLVEKKQQIKEVLQNLNYFYKKLSLSIRLNKVISTSSYMMSFSTVFY
jgi:hypothetical protein